MNLQRWPSVERVPWPAPSGPVSPLAPDGLAAQAEKTAAGTARRCSGPARCATVLGELPRLLAESAASFVRS